MYTWFKDKRITDQLKNYWNEGMLTKDIAKSLTKEFKIRITDAAIRSHVRPLGLTLRSVRTAKTSPKKSPPVSEPPKPATRKPSLPVIPKSKFLDAANGSFDTF